MNELVRIEVEDIRTEAIVGWIEYDHGDFLASDDMLAGIVEFYRGGGESDENIIARLSAWSNGVYRAYRV